MAGRKLILILAFAISLSHAVSCYGFSGFEYTGQVVCRGSRTCCDEEEGTCLDNRLCHKAGDDQNVFIRGPCAEDPYDESKCGAICVYNETLHHNNLLPRVIRCDNGSFCCKKDQDCCENGDGVFIDTDGNIVESTSTSSASSTATESSSDEPRPASSDTESSSIGLKVGLGLGIPLAALITALGMWFLLKGRKRATAPAEDQNGAAGTKYYHPPPSELYTDSRAGELDTSRPSEPAELGAQPTAERGG